MGNADSRSCVGEEIADKEIHRSTTHSIDNTVNNSVRPASMTETKHGTVIVQCLYGAGPSIRLDVSNTTSVKDVLDTAVNHRFNLNSLHSPSPVPLSFALVSVRDGSTTQLDPESRVEFGQVYRVLETTQPLQWIAVNCVIDGGSPSAGELFQVAELLQAVKNGEVAHLLGIDAGNEIVCTSSRGDAPISDWLTALENSRGQLTLHRRLKYPDIVLDRCLEHRISGIWQHMDAKKTGQAEICGHLIGAERVLQYCDVCAVELHKCKCCGAGALKLFEWDARLARQVIEKKVQECQTLGSAGARTIAHIYEPVLQRIPSHEALLERVESCLPRVARSLCDLIAEYGCEHGEVVPFRSFRELLEWCLVLDDPGKIPRGLCLRHWFAAGGGAMTMDRGHCRKCGGGTPSGMQKYHEKCAQLEHKCYYCGRPEVDLTQLDVGRALELIASFRCQTELTWDPIRPHAKQHREAICAQITRQFALVERAVQSRVIYLWAQLHQFLNAINRFPSYCPRPKNEWMLEFYLGH